MPKRRRQVRTLLSLDVVFICLLSIARAKIYSTPCNTLAKSGRWLLWPEIISDRALQEDPATMMHGCQTPESSLIPTRSIYISYGRHRHATTTVHPLIWTVRRFERPIIAQTFVCDQ
jgi:hypothetical protein